MCVCVIANFSIKISYDNGYISSWCSIVYCLKLVVGLLFLLGCIISWSIDLHSLSALTCSYCLARQPFFVKYSFFHRLG